MAVGYLPSGETRLRQRGNSRGWGGTASFTGETLGDGSYDEQQMWALLEDAFNEPDWRSEAEKAEAFYDGDQIDVETLRRMEELAIPPVIDNYIAPSIDAVAGFESIARLDPRLVPENDNSVDGVEALNEKFKEAHRLSEFNQAYSQAFMDQIKVGIGWVVVAHSADVHGYAYRVEHVPWREMWWDYRARKWNLEDARFIVRQRWTDLDHAVKWFPKHREMLETIVGGWMSRSDFIGASFDQTHISSRLSYNLQNEERWSLTEDEWRNTDRRRLAIYEILYRVPGRTLVLRFADGRTMDFNPDIPIHNLALAEGVAELVEGPTMNLRQAFYAGPYKLVDQPLGHGRCHYIPMFAKRKGANLAPYGMIRSMISPQEAINARSARILFDMNSRKVIVDEDAADDLDEIREEAGKGDAFMVLRSERRRENALQILPNTETTAISFQMMQADKQAIEDVSGINKQFRGQVQSGKQAGVAIDQLIDQTKQNIAGIYRNHEQARLEGGRLLHLLIMDDLSNIDDLPVDVGSSDSTLKRRIVLNGRRGDRQIRSNDVIMLSMRVALSSTPSTATYRQQKFQALAEIIKALPPELQTPLTPLMIQAADLPQQEEVLETIRSLTGFGPPPRDPEKARQLEEQKAKEQQMQERMQQIEMMQQEAVARKMLAEAMLNEARARKVLGVDTEQTEAATLVDLESAKTEGQKVNLESRELDLREREVAVKEKESDARILESAARLRNEDRRDRIAASAPAKKAA